MFACASLYKIQRPLFEHFGWRADLKAATNWNELVRTLVISGSYEFAVSSLLIFFSTPAHVVKRVVRDFVEAQMH
jgi:hypothetical protein